MTQDSSKEYPAHETLERYHRASRFDGIDCPELCEEFESLLAAQSSADDIIKELVESLKDIAGLNDVDGNSMMCDTHEECQYAAQAALRKAQQYLGEGE